MPLPVLSQQPAHFHPVSIGKQTFDHQFAVAMRIKVLEGAFLKDWTSDFGNDLHETTI